MFIFYVVIFRSINGFGIRYTESTLSREGVGILTSHHVERVENVRSFLNDDIQLIDHVSHRARCSLQNKAKVGPLSFRIPISHRSLGAVWSSCLEHWTSTQSVDQGHTGCEKGSTYVQASLIYYYELKLSSSFTCNVQHDHQ